MSEQETDVRPGKEPAAPDVPDFDLIRPVGSGGFGQVWLATNRTTGHRCAVKLIPLRQSGRGQSGGSGDQFAHPLGGQSGPAAPEPADDPSRGQDVPITCSM